VRRWMAIVLNSEVRVSRSWVDGSSTVSRSWPHGWIVAVHYSRRFVRLLDAGPCPLALDGRQLGAGLPARQIPISELWSFAMSPTAPHQLQERIIGAVIERLQQEPIPWVIVLGGFLLPGTSAGLPCICSSSRGSDPSPVERHCLGAAQSAQRILPAVQICRGRRLVAQCLRSSVVPRPSTILLPPGAGRSRTTPDPRPSPTAFPQLRIDMAGPVRTPSRAVEGLENR
jgi:hypothetical protein